MRRLPILLAFGLVFALLIVAAATAAPPDFCDEEKFGLNHANCEEPPTEPPPEPPATQQCDTITTREGSVQLNCEWTPENEGATFGTVKVEAVSGEISKVAVWVLDDFPGDICVFDEWNNAKTMDKVFEVQFPFVNDGGETYWGNGTHWCAQFDDARVEALADLNGDPLHVRVNLRVRKGTVVNVTLTPAQDTPPEGG